MADESIDYSHYAGHVAFPRSTADLVSTAHCPACLAALTSTICSTCGLDLTHPDAARLYETSVTSARTLDERRAIIGKMRYDTAHAASPVPEPVIAEARPAPPPLARPQAASSATSTVAAASSATSTVAPATSATPPVAPASRRSGVQVTLLVVGVSLLSVAAIFFLVYAFINFGIIWRSVIIAAITVAAITGAALLGRRGLRATAEGIAAFGVVLVYLDAYAVRANDFFDISRANGAMYWGSVMIVTAVVFLAWSRVSGLRIPSIIGFGSFPIGVGVLVGGLARHEPVTSTVYLAFTSIAAAGLIHGLASRPGLGARVERAVALAISLFAALVSLATCVAAFPYNNWAPAVSAVALAAVSAAHVWTLSRSYRGSRLARTFAWIFAALVGIGSAAAVGFCGPRITSEQFNLMVPTVAAVAVALLLGAAVTRMAAGATRTLVIIAGWGAAGVSAVVAFVPVFSVSASAMFASIGTGIPSWSIQPTDAVRQFSANNLWAVACLAIVTALAAGVWASTGQLASRAQSTTILSGALVAVVAAVPEFRAQWAVMVGWLVIAAAALIALLLLRSRESAARRYRAPLIAATATAATLGYVTGLASTTTWWIGTVALIGMLVAARALVVRSSAKAALLGIGMGFALLSAGSVADQLTLGAGLGIPVVAANHLVVTALAAGAVLFGSSIPGGGVSVLDRRVEYWIAAGFGMLAVPASIALISGLGDDDRLGLLLPVNDASLAIALLFLLSSALWIGLRSNRVLRPERIVASIVSAPLLSLAASALARLAGLPDLVDTVAPMVAALLAATASLAITLLRPAIAPRWTRELGVALVGIPALWSAIRADDELTWLAFLLAAVAALLLAIDREGLFTSRSARHHVGWLALGLATAGLWWRLTGDRVTNLEYYVVPLTLALLAIAVLVARTAHRERPPRIAAAAPLIALGGLLVSILPLGANTADGLLAHALGVFIVAAALLMAGSAIPRARHGQGFADASATAGAVGIVVVAAGRSLFLPETELERDLWLVAAFLLLILAAFLQARIRSAHRARLRAVASQALAIVGLVMLLLFELPGIRESDIGGVRAEVLVLLFSAIHVMAILVSRAPLTALVGIVAIVAAAIGGLAGLWAESLRHVEFASIPIAAALLTTGYVHLRSTPRARSWAWLAPGTVILLASSLLATLDERPLWRLVGLGVAGIAVIIVGVVLRLQAPFAIGTIVVLTHAIATFLPQLRTAYESLPWWLWLGAGGVILIALAARYEHRIRNLKNAAIRFAALR